MIDQKMYLFIMNCEVFTNLWDEREGVEPSCSASFVGMKWHVVFLRWAVINKQMMLIGSSPIWATVVFR